MMANFVASVIGHKQFSRCFNIAVNIHGKILVADWRHHSMYIFTLNGNYIDQVAIQKGTDVQLKEPCSITTDSDGFILMTEFSNHCITIFDEIGNCIRSFGSEGSGNGKFNHPHGIAVAPNGAIHVINS